MNIFYCGSKIYYTERIRDKRREDKDKFMIRENSEDLVKIQMYGIGVERLYISYKSQVMPG